MEVNKLKKEDRLDKKGDRLDKKGDRYGGK